MDAERFIYKCRRCGKHEMNTECGEDMGWRHLQHAIHGINWPPNQPPLSMQSTHRCGDGGYGITDLIGCEPVGANAQAEARRRVPLPPAP